MPGSPDNIFDPTPGIGPLIPEGFWWDQIFLWYKRGQKINYAQASRWMYEGHISREQFGWMKGRQMLVGGAGFADLELDRNLRSGAMPLFRVTYFFTGGKYGWSETYYRTSDNFDLVPPVAEALGVRRRGVLVQQYTLEAYRISQEGVFRDSKVFYVNPGAGVGLYPASATTAQQPFDALLCRFEASQFHRRQLYLRGIPVDVLDPYGAYLQVPPFNDAIVLFFNLLKASPWQVRIPDPVQTPVTIKTLVVRNGDPRFLDITVDPPIPGAAINQVYKVLKVTSPRGASKLWRLDSVSNGGATMGLGPNKFPLVGVWNGQGSLTGQYLYVGSNITGTDVVRGVRKSTGRPFGSPVGKQSGQ